MDMNSSLQSCPKCHSASCLCVNCIEEIRTSNNALSEDSNGLKEDVIITEPRIKSIESSRKCWDKVYPSKSQIGNQEPHSPSFSGEEVGGHFSVSLTRSTDTSSSNLLSVNGSPCRSDDDEGEDPNEYFNETSDLDSKSLCARDVFYSFSSMGSMLSTSVEIDQVHKSSSSNTAPFDHEHILMERPSEKIWDSENTNNLTKLQQDSEKLPKPLNIETDLAIWLPPPPKDVNDELEGHLFTYDDDIEEVENSGDIYLPSADDTLLPAKELDCNEPFKALVLGHFRSLVSQLLLAEHLVSTEDSTSGIWLEIITSIAWQAVKYIKPDTKVGGSMDPCDYLKIKRVASGSPGESKLVKGIVCTKNIKHKRMISQYKNARLLILGGALEYQRASSHMLASVQTLLHQENDHLKTVVSQIEAHRPNILLVEKNVSLTALEQLFAKEISVVLNVKRSLLERIARCTGSFIIPSTDDIPQARLGHCELFHLEKISEEHELVNHRKPSKTLMFFEGCPRRVCCTILLKGSSREELKKVKHVMQYAVFAAYQLSLETSFLADEGARINDMDLKPLNLVYDTVATSMKLNDSESTTSFKEEANVSSIDSEGGDFLLDIGLEDSWSEHVNGCQDYFSVPDELGFRKKLYGECPDFHPPYDDAESDNLGYQGEALKQEEGHIVEVAASSPMDDDALISDEKGSVNDNNQSILVSFSSNCMVNGSACERARLLRVKFYSPSDKPLGRYLRDDLFDQSYLCKSCHEPAEAHVMCYTHQNANLTIKVRHLPSVKLPGEQDGKIWMWHRCLKCEPVEGVPPATKRVVMSDAAWGLSFGKFLELSFHNHVTGNRIAACGHSPQRDCLRFFGFGSMIASFQYSHINILSVHLPPPILEFDHPLDQSSVREEAYELFSKAEALFTEISSALEILEMKSLSGADGIYVASEFQSCVTELKDMLTKEKNQYKNLLQLANKEIGKMDQMASDILEINRLRVSLSISSQSWDRRLYLLESFLNSNSVPKALNDDYNGLRDSDNASQSFDNVQDIGLEFDAKSKLKNDGLLSPPENLNGMERMSSTVNKRLLDRLPSAGSMLSDCIDSAWSGVDPSLIEDEFFDDQSSLRRELRSASFDLTGASNSLNATRFSQLSTHESGKFDEPRFIVHDNEPTSIIAHALSSKEYKDWVQNKVTSNSEGVSQGGLLERLDSLVPDLSRIDSSHTNHHSFISEDQNHHVQISFDDDESSKASGKVKYSVTCYFAREFDALRRMCCPNEMNFIRSLSRCREWSAQGGKSNVYFAKTLDERFIIKQVTKTELDSFEAFGPGYFKYLTEALHIGSPTCLAKVLGIYQVGIKGMKGGKEAKKMDLMIMENLFFKRNISKVYDLKGSLRSRYISDTTGTNKVLLDMNLLKTVGKNPIFVGSKTKRNLERAVWNDTSFLASVDVMDYSLLVGVDEERKELVMGIIDYIRQYTWDKQLETWVKASGILGGTKNALPTVISPLHYKKRFRKAMTSYFLTVPDQWTSSS